VNWWDLEQPLDNKSETDKVKEMTVCKTNIHIKDIFEEK
jgi:hypothetical protein